MLTLKNRMSGIENPAGRYSRFIRGGSLLLLLACHTTDCAYAQAAKQGRASSSRQKSPGAARADKLNPFGVEFQDVTQESGIHFHHERAASEERLYVETMGSGVG